MKMAGLDSGTVKKLYYFTEKGNRSQECKDTVYFRENGDFGFYSLADGLNSKQFSHIGARAIQKALADEWERNPESFFDKEDGEIKKRFIEIIHGVIYNLTNQLKDADEFASTLMILFVSRKHSRYKWIHIGDGVILKENCWGERDILSYEHNGITGRYTFTTTSEPLSRLLHVGSGNMNLIHRFLLFTDGAILPFYKERNINLTGDKLMEQGAEKYHAFLRKLPIKDDYSLLDVWV